MVANRVGFGINFVLTGPLHIQEVRNLQLLMIECILQVLGTHMQSGLARHATTSEVTFSNTVIVMSRFRCENAPRIVV